MSIRTLIKEKNPYLAEDLYELKFMLRSLKYKTNSKRIRKKRLAKMYKKCIGCDLNFENPKRYTEKIQCRKLSENNKIYGELSDKYEVRKWVAERIGEEYLIPLLGHWDSFDQIDFSKLPQKFVLKTNNASGTNVIIKNKEEIDYKLLKKKFDFWMRMDFAYSVGYEMHYQLIKPQIIAEKYIESDEDDLRDYKFMCFDGEIKYVWVDTGRFHDHKRTIYDVNWNKQEWKQHTYDSEDSLSKPEKFNQMVEIVQKLASGFDHVRVDLYNTGGGIYFGEMTFTNAGGFERYYPDSMDYKLGKYWNMKE